MNKVVMSVLIALLVVVIGSSFTLGGYTINTLNQEAVLANQIKTKQLNNTNVYDNMWKKISQTAQVTQKDRDSLKDIFNSYAQARSGNGDGQAVMKWIKEAVPNVDTTTMLNLQNTITSARNEFARNQTELLDLANEHNTMFDVFPSNIVLSMFNRHKIDAKLVTSTRTDNAFSTGKDDDTDVFGK
jgi:hypothetical protein